MKVIRKVDSKSNKFYVSFFAVIGFIFVGGIGMEMILFVKINLNDNVSLINRPFPFSGISVSTTILSGILSFIYIILIIVRYFTFLINREED